MSVGHARSSWLNVALDKQFQCRKLLCVDMYVVYNIKNVTTIFYKKAIVKRDRI